AADGELLSGLGHYLETDLDREFAELLHALHLERLDDGWRQVRVGHDLLADLLDDLLHPIEIGIVGNADRELVDHPVAAHVLHRAELAERYCEEIAAMVPQLDRAQRERLDRALVLAADDVLADPERVVEQIEHAGNDVADQSLR